MGLNPECKCCIYSLYSVHHWQFEESLQHMYTLHILHVQLTSSLNTAWGEAGLGLTEKECQWYQHQPQSLELLVWMDTLDKTQWCQIKFCKTWVDGYTAFSPSALLKKRKPWLFSTTLITDIFLFRPSFKKNCSVLDHFCTKYFTVYNWSSALKPELLILLVL